MSPLRNDLMDHPNNTLLASQHDFDKLPERSTWNVEGMTCGEKEQGNDGSETESHVAMHVCCEKGRKRRRMTGPLDGE
jgi:hypothetical protein